MMPLALMWSCDFCLLTGCLKCALFLIHRASIRNIVSQKKQTKKQKATYGYLRSFLVPEDVIYLVLASESFPLACLPLIYNLVPKLSQS